MMARRQQERKKMHNQNSNNNEDDDKENMNNHLANERTFLAWTRTGLTIFTLGAAIGRFGGTGSTTTTSLRGPNAQKKPLISGVVLCFIGVLSLLYGIWRFCRTHQRIKHKRAPTRLDIFGPIISVIVLSGALVAVIIIIFII